MLLSQATFGPSTFIFGQIYPCADIAFHISIKLTQKVLFALGLSSLQFPQFQRMYFNIDVPVAYFSYSDAY